MGGRAAEHVTADFYGTKIGLGSRSAFVCTSKYARPWYFEIGLNADPQVEITYSSTQDPTYDYFWVHTNTWNHGSIEITYYSVRSPEDITITATAGYGLDSTNLTANSSTTNTPATITVSSDTVTKTISPVPYSRTTDQVGQIMREGSLFAWMNEATDNLLLGTSGLSRTLFTSPTSFPASPEPTTYTRNTSGIMASTDLSCISPWNSRGGGKRCGTVITPRHVVMVNHINLGVESPPYGFSVWPGDTMHFVDMNNNLYTRTVVTNNYKVDSGDITVCMLDSDLPASIKPAKFLAADYTDYVPITRNIPMFYRNQYNTVYWSANRQQDGFENNWFKTLYSSSNIAEMNETFSSDWIQYWGSGGVSGDSGSLIFMPALPNGDIIAIGCFVTTTSGNELYQTVNQDWIQSTIDAQTSVYDPTNSYSIEYADLSAFNSIN